jgi:hypothetical protein
MLKKNRALLFAALVATLSVAVVSFGYIVLTSQNNSGFIPPYPLWVTDPSKQVSLSQLAAGYFASNLTLTLKLPTSLPGGLILTSIHVPNVTDPSGFAVLTYSTHGITDFRYAEVVIQVIPGATPNQTDLAAAAGDSRSQLLTVAGMPVILNPQAYNGDPALLQQFGPVVYARFWSNGIYYQIRAYQPLSASDVLGMIASVQPVKVQ